MKILILIFSIVCVLGCSVDYISEEPYYNDVWLEVYYTISPISDQEQWGRVDYWETPDELNSTHEADCEGYCMQFLDLLYKETGYFGEMCIIKYPTYWKQHAIIKIGDVYLEPQIYGLTYDLEDISILFTYTYEELLFVATYIRAIEQ